MPLAQNYKDDVSLLESEAAFTNTTMNSINTVLPTRQGTHVSKEFFALVEWYPETSRRRTTLCFNDRSTLVVLHIAKLRVGV